MSNFDKFQKEFVNHFNSFVQCDQLFRSNVDGNQLYELYLGSFPPHTNELFNERTEHDCNSCKSFIRQFGNLVKIVDNKIVSVWNIPNLEHPYNIVTKSLAELNESSNIKSVFAHYNSKCGTSTNIQMLEDGTLRTWHHLNGIIPRAFIKDNKNIDSFVGESKGTKDVFARAMRELTKESALTILEIIDQNSLYRGEEYRAQLTQFIKLKNEYDSLGEPEKDNWCWANSANNFVSRIRNTAIGTLLVDISNNVDLDVAVSKFEKIMAPTNYKRPKAIFTAKMVKEAEQKINELGYGDSLARRHAHPEDITINNVLFVDRDTKSKLQGSIFEDLISQAVSSPKKFDKLEEVTINDFVEKILPNCSNIELMVENRHESNFMNIIAPVNNGAKSMFKWSNNFSWAYNGDITDSMKQRVKEAGGKVDGFLRFSIQWNNEGKTNSDYDAHCKEPAGHIYYANKYITSTGGNLDVDIMYPNKKVAVENITWPTASKMRDGIYEFRVHCFNKNNGFGGFQAELECDGEILAFEYPSDLKNGEYVKVAKVEFTKKNGLKVLESLSSTKSSKEIFGVKTNEFIKTKMVLLSPNHWDENSVGNKHYFFIIDGAINHGSPRGFFNEFLNNDLDKHKRVFEALGSKMRVEHDDRQLCGLGFSSTQNNSVVMRVTGKTKRVIKVNF